MRKVRLLALVPLVIVAGSREASSQISASLARPQCYEEIGCPHADRMTELQLRDLSCRNLWLVRNTIFHQRGYCFTTVRGRAEFDNRGCWAASPTEIKLSPIEAANIDAVRRVERLKGCE